MQDPVTLAGKIPECFKKGPPNVACRPNYHPLVNTKRIPSWREMHDRKLYDRWAGRRAPGSFMPRIVPRDLRAKIESEAKTTKEKT